MMYSNYYSQLDVAAQSHYSAILALLCRIQDPYLHQTSTSDFLMEWQHWPEVEYADIYNYLVATPSAYTQDQLKAYISLDAYNFFANGRVANVSVTSVPRVGSYLIRAKVCHSQKLSAPCLQPWVGVEKDSKVLCAHCTCKAGLSEACLHVVVLLFAVDMNTQMKTSLSCTSMPCSWLPPSFQAVPYAEISDIKFYTPKNKKRNLNTISTSPTPEDLNSIHKLRHLTEPTATELDSFYTSLSKIKNCKPGILSVIPRFSHCYMPLCKQGVLPPPLSDLFLKEHLNLPYTDLIQECERCFCNLTITPEHCKNIEKHTRDQSNSKLWFQQRAGRITASHFKSAACTDPALQSQSLIKKICYPENHYFHTKQTYWGCAHEKTTYIAYINQSDTQHTGFQNAASGLVISPVFPFLGASPDGTVCCGAGMVEIKFPYSCKDIYFRV